MPFSTKSLPNYSFSLTEDQLMEIFKDHDKNKDGNLNKEELEEALTHLGSSLPKWRARRCLRHADADKDGHISKEELGHLAKYTAKREYKLHN